MLADNMNSSLSDNCQYWIGEAYFAKKEFEQAIIEFDKVLFFANNNKREHSIYKIAFCHENLGEKKQALEMYKRYLADYPNGDYSKLALKKLDELQY